MDVHRPNTQGLLAQVLWAAALTAATSVPFGRVERLALAVLLLCPLGLVAALAQRGLARALDRPAHRGRALAFGAVATVTALLALGELVTVYVPNEVFVDAPYGRWSCLSYLGGSLVALGLVAGVAALLWRAHRRGRLQPALAATLLVGAALAGAFEAGGLAGEYTRTHAILLVATVTGFAAAMRLLQTPARRRPFGRGAMVLALGLVALAGSTTAPAAQPPHGDGLDGQLRRLWQAGALLDADEAVAEPAPAREPTLVAPGAGLQPDAPRRVVLVTIDAFRCGFGGGEPSALRDACPEITRLAQEGRVRFDHWANAPQTLPSVAALLGGDPRAASAPKAPGPSLPGVLRQLGYRTRAIVTHPYAVAAPRVRDGFDEIDRSLVASSLATHFTAEAVTDRLLADLASGGRLFVWAHYFDPHYPYVVDPAAPLRDGSIEAYATAVRRTDAAIGRLVRALAADPHAEDLLLVLTADHGEELGEHGDVYHGSSLHEAAVRVPLVVWSPRRPLAAAEALPISHDRVPAFLLHLLTGAPAPADGPVLMSAQLERDPQHAVLDGRWKLIEHPALGTDELYDLAADPDERNDLSLGHAAVPVALANRR